MILNGTGTGSKFDILGEVIKGTLWVMVWFACSFTRIFKEPPGMRGIVGKVYRLTKCDPCFFLASSKILNFLFLALVSL